jgi:hypothetical protein
LSAGFFSLVSQVTGKEEININAYDYQNNAQSGGNYIREIFYSQLLDNLCKLKAIYKTFNGC